ncbi:hypothetical protein SELMODRAFT_235430 [Selaginella moellendorffii]|uniref:Argonaute family member n=1 Tax=Selaginella moellendorffii TaxID=88036 RepID=D8SXH6_SELML|nr:hypothetical protein SELMODRAFT_235430 [Selaginella moellendorffii]
MPPRREGGRGGGRGGGDGRAPSQEWRGQEEEFRQGRGRGRGGRNPDGRGQGGREGGGGRGAGAGGGGPSRAPLEAFPPLGDRRQQQIPPETSQRPRTIVSAAGSQRGYGGTPAGPSAPVSSSSTGDVPTSSKALVPPKRPDRGTVGQKVTIRVNHFKMKVKDAPIFHYDVSIHPAVGSKGIARALERQLVSQYRASELNNLLPVYDGSKSLYTARRLPFEQKDFKVTLPEEEGRRAREFKVTIKFAAELDPYQMDLFLEGRGAVLQAPYEFLQALDVALREWPMKSYVPSGRNFFDPSFGRLALEGGFEAWKGFYQSVRPTMQGLVLNVDLSAAAFYEALPVLEFLKKSLPYFDPSRGLSDGDRAKAKNLLNRLKVEVTHRNIPRRYRISGLSLRPTKALTFTTDSGQEVKVVDYFWTTYKHKIQYPELPCLELQGRKTTYLPMEVCKLAAGQKYQGKLNERQTTNMLRFTCQIPAVREQNIKTLMSNVHDFQQNDYAAEFGIQVAKSMTSLHARVLPTPSLRYSSNQITPSDGGWNMMRSRFLRGGVIRRWTLVNFTRLAREDVDAFISELIQRCVAVGVQMDPPVIPPSSGRLEQYDTLLRNAVRNHASKSKPGEGLQLVVCLMDAKHQIYGDLKKLCETELGLVTQVCLKKNVMKEYNSLSQYLANLAMKINVKVGGQNMDLAQDLRLMVPSILGKPTIIFGADVSHPMARDDTSPSISAVVASMDWPSAVKYLARARSQRGRVEMIEHLHDMVVDLMRAFFTHTRLKPERLLFFRDGVSEGQFSDVLNNEVQAIQRAFLTLQPNGDYCPQITFVVVQKRHHTRFFPADNNVVSNNVRPGTVVDTEITHPREFDFYLCSHRGLQGTSRPTHYHVLLDQNGFRADQLQTLVNSLCYTYARCTKAVSVIPPAYYAHLVAYRSRLHVDSVAAGAGSSSARAAAAECRLPEVLPEVRNYMYYC